MQAHTGVIAVAACLQMLRLIVHPLLLLLLLPLMRLGVDIRYLETPNSDVGCSVMPKYD